MPSSHSKHSFRFLPIQTFKKYRVPICYGRVVTAKEATTKRSSGKTTEEKHSLKKVAIFLHNFHHEATRSSIKDIDLFSPNYVAHNFFVYKSLIFLCASLFSSELVNHALSCFYAWLHPQVPPGSDWFEEKGGEKRGSHAEKSAKVQEYAEFVEAAWLKRLGFFLGKISSPCASGLRCVHKVHSSGLFL